MLRTQRTRVTVSHAHKLTNRSFGLQWSLKMLHARYVNELWNMIHVTLTRAVGPTSCHVTAYSCSLVPTCQYRKCSLYYESGNFLFRLRTLNCSDYAHVTRYTTITPPSPGSHITLQCRKYFSIPISHN